MKSITYPLFRAMFWLILPLTLLVDCSKSGSRKPPIADNSTFPSENYTGLYSVYRNGIITETAEYKDGKKDGKETLYYRTTGKIMATNSYRSGVREGTSERYEDYTSNLISSCEYKEGAIFSGAALLNYGASEINPDQVITQDLAYHVAMYKDGKQVGEEKSQTLFGHLWRK